MRESSISADGLPTERLSRIFEQFNHLASVPREARGDLAQVLGQVKPLVYEVRLIVAYAIDKVLAAHAKDEFVTIEEKRLIRAALADVLDDLRLSLQCPNTRRPARLQVHTGKGVDRARGDFQLDSRGRQRTAHADPKLPSVNVVPAESVARPGRKPSRG